jgi:transposase
MNERIKELERQATETVKCGLNGTSTTESFNRKKFSELIVREMLQTCKEHPAWTGRMIGEEIKQHFGVEE